MADTMNPLACEPLECVPDAEKCAFLRSVYEQHWAELRSYHDREQQVVNWTGAILAGIAVGVLQLLKDSPFAWSDWGFKWLAALFATILIAAVALSQLAILGRFARFHADVAKGLCRIHWLWGALTKGYYTGDDRPLLPMPTARTWGSHIISEDIRKLPVWHQWSHDLRASDGHYRVFLLCLTVIDISLVWLAVCN